MCGIKIPLHDFLLKIQGGGGIFAGHYSAPEQVNQLLKILIESFLSFKTVCCAYHLLF